MPDKEERTPPSRPTFIGAPYSRRRERNAWLSGPATVLLKAHVLSKLAGGWDVSSDAFNNFRTNGDANQAAAIALYAILSMIPLLVLTLIAISSFFGAHPAIQADLIETVHRYYPGFSGDLLRQLGQIEVKRHFLGWVGILSLIWLSSMIFNALETALSIIFRSRKSRNYLVSKLLAISMIPMAWAIGIASIGVAYVAALLARQPLLIKGVPFVIPVLQGLLVRNVLPWLVTTVFFALIYKLIPTGRVAWRSALIGGAVFAVLMEVAKYLFSWYVSRYTYRYNIIFGSLETVVILVLWVFYIATILLFCAEIISSYQRRDLILLERAFLSTRKSMEKMDERLFRKFGQMYPRGRIIYREGDPGQEMYYLLSGRVLLERQAGGVRKPLLEIGPGGYFGEAAALIEAPRTETAVAIADSDLAVIDGATFLRLLRESGELSLFMLQEYSQKMRQAEEVLEALSDSWLELRILLYLLKEWPLREGLDLMDALTGVTGKEAADISRVMGELCRQGLCALEGNRMADFYPDKVWAFLDRHRNGGREGIPPGGGI